MKSNRNINTKLLDYEYANLYVYDNGFSVWVKKDEAKDTWHMLSIINDVIYTDGEKSEITEIHTAFLEFTRGDME